MKIPVKICKTAKKACRRRAAMAIPVSALVHNSFDMSLFPRQKALGADFRFGLLWSALRAGFSAAASSVRSLSLPRLVMPAAPAMGRLGAALLAAAVFAPYSAPVIREAQAYFSAETSSLGNIFNMGTLSFQLSAGAWDNPARLSSLQPGTSVSRDVQVENTGTMRFRYQVSAEQAGGDNGYCAALNLKIRRAGDVLYEGPLLSAAASPVPEVEQDGSGNLNYEFGISGSLADFDNKNCDINLKFSGYQWNVANPQDGFGHIEQMPLSFASGAAAVVVPSLQAGDVIINEIMWMGSEDDLNNQDTADEWIELRNMTGSEIDISNWRIYGAVSGSGHLQIPAGYSIPANGYFLISNKGKSDSAINVDVDLVKTSVSLHNNYSDNGQLKLTNKTGSVELDKTPLPSGSSWPVGISAAGKRWSMERNLTPGSGTLAGDWHTCDRGIMAPAQLALMVSYWDSDADSFNCGTPKAENLSKNDPTASDYDPAAGGGDTGGGDLPQESGGAENLSAGQDAAGEDEAPGESGGGQEGESGPAGQEPGLPAGQNEDEDGDNNGQLSQNTDTETGQDPSKEEEGGQSEEQEQQQPLAVEPEDPGLGGAPAEGGQENE